jgi:hypothetical protein
MSLRLTDIAAANSYESLGMIADHCWAFSLHLNTAYTLWELGVTDSLQFTVDDSLHIMGIPAADSRKIMRAFSDKLGAGVHILRTTKFFRTALNDRSAWTFLMFLKINAQSVYTTVIKELNFGNFLRRLALAFTFLYSRHLWHLWNHFSPGEMRWANVLREELFLANNKHLVNCFSLQSDLFIYSC